MGDALQGATTGHDTVRNGRRADRKVFFVTPSFHRDFNACRLLCETMDVYAAGHQHHYIVVQPRDLPLFSSLNQPGRTVIDAQSILPRSLRGMPFGLRWKNRDYLWAPGILPIYGWHLQQLIKIYVSLNHSGDRLIMMDSDNFFCRPFDVQALAGQDKVPLYVAPGEITRERPMHVRFLAAADRMLGLPISTPPADDYIGQVIVWEGATVAAMTRQIERITGGDWWFAMARERMFSEYVTYGRFAATDPEARLRHVTTEKSQCLTYWNGDRLDRAGLEAFVAGLQPHQSAVAVQSFTGTPVDLMRAIALGEPAGMALT